MSDAVGDAMREVAKAYREDPDVQVLFADALMNLQPWDYWEADKRTPTRLFTIGSFAVP